MPRRELLTSAQRIELVAPPSDEGELIRRYTLSKSDIAFVRQHRGDQNRLGVAVQMAYLWYPSRVLARDERPYPPLLGMLSAQLNLSPSMWDVYAERDQTRREHLQEIIERLQLVQFSRTRYRAIADWLLPLAMQTTNGMALAQAVVDELRKQHIIVPPAAAIERLCAEVSTRAQRQVFKLLTATLTNTQRMALDQLLERKQDRPVTTLAWLRQSPGAPSAKAVLHHIARLKAIRALGLPADIGRTVHQNRLLRLVREGAQTAAFQIADYEIDRRHAMLVAIVIDTAATLTDEILDLHDRLIGSFFTKSKHKYEKTFAASGKSVNDKVRMLAKVGTALIDAKKAKADPYTAIEAVVSWERFTESVLEAEQLARDENFDHLALVADHYTQLRRYEPALLETFEFRAAPVVQDIVDAIAMLKALNQSGDRKVPADAPTGFVRKRWQPFVFKEGGIDRKYYELCAMAELKNAVRAGDVAVVGSRQFKDFDEYLMPRTEFAQRQADDRLGVAITATGSTYLNERLELLRQTLDEVNQLAAAGGLPDAELTDSGLKVSPLDNETPEEGEALKQRTYNLLPHVKITDLLLEVDQWTDFTCHFTHLKSGDSAKDRALLLTAILSDALNLGLAKMAEACPGTSLAKLSWLVAWHIRDETYSKALAELVNHQHRIPFAKYWGEGTTSSSDGQRYRAGGHGGSAGQVNARYGNEPGVLFYTHVSDQYAPFHTKVINATVRDATHVLDGLLYHESDLRIEEHYTDTAGFTDHVFALFHVVGFRFAPRIRDLADKRLYVPGKASQWPALASIIGAPLNQKLIEQQFPEILRLGSSIKHGTVTASLMMRKLSAYPRQNSLAVALREFGRIERTLFELEWLRDPALRRRVNTGLNKGEARNTLARAVFFHRLGEIRDRSYENQRYRASGLNLVVAAITLWNTVYLEKAIEALCQHETVDETLLPHVSPLGWEHINLTGDYVWHANKRVAKGRFRPLRPVKSP